MQPATNEHVQPDETDRKQQDIVLSFNERGDSKLDAELTYFAEMFNDASMELLMCRYSQVLEILSVTGPGSMEDLKAVLSRL
jgi:hypothetical protein